MTKKIVFIFLMVLLLSSTSYATLFSFSDIDLDGTGSATMDINIGGNILTAAFNNTSPTTLNSGPGDNAPGVTGFGFDLLNATLPSISSWTLTAFEVDNSGMTPVVSGSPVVIGSDPNDVGADGTADNTDDKWIMDTFIAGVTMDYLPATDGNNIQGALYNPAAVTSSQLAALPNFFTSALLTMTFDAPPLLDETSDINPFNPFVRMQNVGLDGKGSLKLTGGPGDPPNGDPPNGTVPIPSTLLLFGNGLLGLVYCSRRMKKK